ncbi:hypothetical protein J3R82DRAFT_2930 [Butyriboletus roseoflavus]|nr:hypothetical protein J3R82DRAFT_2930 [Butyriboletus roseoflavus]
MTIATILIICVLMLNGVGHHLSFRVTVLHSALKFPKKTVESLVQLHSIVAFIDIFQGFIIDLDHECQTTFQPTIHNYINGFNNVQIPFKPLVHSLKNKMVRICCHLKYANSPHKPPIPAHYDTILVQVNAAAYKIGGFHSKTSLCGV